jgi:vanillate O-demethylase ferredoxin subunit
LNSPPENVAGEHSMNKPADAIQVRVRSITYLGDGINAYEVIPVAESTLPAFTAGSHIDLYFRDGRVRQYSLCNDPAETHRYVFAVQREDHGRGGSKAIHEVVQAGRILAISVPRNNFPLHEEAGHHVLIAGGIGITPVMSMIHRLLAIDATFELHYSVRYESKLAFHDELRRLGLVDQVNVYVDGGDPNRGMNVIDIATAAPLYAHFYCCGPAGLMRAVKSATSNRDGHTVHFEHFVGAAPGTKVPEALMGGSNSIGVGFKVRLARQGLVFDVPDDKSIVEVLREHGIGVPTSCEAGVCGTCRTRYLEGEPDHRDFVLEEDARRQEVLICCSRSKTPELVLDL